MSTPSSSSCAQSGNQALRQSDNQATRQSGAHRRRAAGHAHTVKWGGRGGGGGAHENIRGAKGEP
eukprot:3922348-Prymnesium_polylepis.1